MSADDFQTKYSSVMESMLKGAVAETTKLFETMVDELKAEISRIKEENDDLKTRCSRFETGQPAVYSRGRSPLPGHEKRDRAVQCDLIPFNIMVVEQCQPVEQNQEQQFAYEEGEHSLQEHNYFTHGEANSEIAYIVVKQEELDLEYPLQSDLKQEEVDHAAVSGQILSDNGGLPQASDSRSENEGPLIIQQCSTKETTSNQNDEETRMVVEPSSLGVDSSSQGAQSQSSQPQNTLVIPPAPVKDDIEEESAVGQKVSETWTPGELRTSEEHQLAPQQSQRDSETSLDKQTDVIGQQYADVHRTEEQPAESTLVIKEPNLPVHRRRGRPPKKRKQKEILLSSSADVSRYKEGLSPPSGRKQQGQVSSAVDRVNIASPKSPQTSPDELKETSSIIAPTVQDRSDTALKDVENRKVGSLPVSVVSVSSSCPSEKQKPSKSQNLPMAIEEKVNKDPSTEVSSACDALKTPPVESSHTTSVQLKEHHTSVTLQDAMLLVEAMNQSTVENTLSCSQRMAHAQTHNAPCVGSLKTGHGIPAEPQTPSLLVQSQVTVERLGVAPQITGSTSSNEAQAQTAVTTPKVQHALPPFNTTTSTMSSLAAASQTTAQSLPHPLKVSVTPSKQSRTPIHKVIVVPRPASSSGSSKIGKLSQAQLCTLVSTAARNNSLPPVSTAAGLHLDTRESLPGVPSQSTATSTNQQSGTSPHPQIIIPRPLSAVASGKNQPLSVVPTAKQESRSSTELISSSQELSAPALDATIFSQKRHNTAENLEPPKEPASVSETVIVPTETCSSSKLSFKLVSKSVSSELPRRVKQKLSPAVRLTRLPFPISPKESVSVAGLLSERSSKETTEEKPSKPAISGTDMPVLLSNICSNLTETSMATEPTTAGGTTPNLSKEIISNKLHEKEMAALFQLTPIMLKDTSDPRSKMTKSQFLAQLAVSPIDPALQKAGSNDFADARPAFTKTSTCEEKSLPKNTILIRLRSHMKSHSQVRRSKTTVISKKPRLENDGLNDENTSSEPIPVICKNPDVVEDTISLNRITNTSSPMSPRRSALRKNGARPWRSVSKPASVRSRKSESTPVSPGGPSAGQCGVGPKNKHTAVSPKRFSSSKEYSGHSRTKLTSVSPKRPGSGRDGVGFKNRKSLSVSPKRSSSTKGSASPKKTKLTSVSPRWSTSSRHSIGSRNMTPSCLSPRRSGSTENSPSSKTTKNGSSPKSTKSTCTSPNWSTRDVSPKKAESTSVIPRTISLRTSETSDEISDSHKSSTFTKDDPRTKQIKRESNSFSPGRYSTTACSSSKKKMNIEAVYVSVKAPKIARNGTSPESTGESTPARKPFQNGAGPKKSVKAMNAMRLAKAAKVNTIAKIKISTKSKLQTRQSAEKQASCEVVKKFRSTAVWIPPVIPAGENGLPLLPVKTETSDHNQNYDYSAILVKGPPIISPLQPLAVIGRHLLKNQCGECGRILSSSAALESHVSLHTGQRPFSCTLCGKSFPNSKVFKRHDRVHRNGRIHICQQCGKGFVYSFGLTKHIQMVHSRIKPFICQICNKGFYTKRDVEIHIRIHTGEKPFPCTLCEKKFTRRVELNVHLRWHKGEKRHWCPYCSKGFLDYNNLKRHKYTHTGEKPHTCPHCPKKFSQSGHMKKHMRNVHKDD
ncbi:uncharacterized protein [Embiotoca jacksoni]|uniref:uncharacterized protein n=1 Tax=Embiotoca jacksoni TaxID=100190 RepID=UPI0037041013